MGYYSDAPLSQTTVANRPCTHVSYGSDGRKENEARYTRSVLGETLRLSDSSSTLIVIPEALVWRKYLNVIRHVIDDESTPLQFVVLESITEYMDHRNQSASVLYQDQTVREPYAPQERQIFKKLIEAHKVGVFSDASHRSIDEALDSFGLSQEPFSQRAFLCQTRAGIELAMSQRVSVWLLFDEARPSTVEGVDFVSMTEFTTKVKLSPQLLSLVKQCNTEYMERLRGQACLGTESNMGTIWNSNTMLEGIRTGTLKQGVLEVSNENILEAYVIIDGKMVFIDGNRGHFDRSFHGDCVAVELLNEADWGRPIGKRKLVYNDRENERLAADGGEDSCPQEPSARVVGVLKEGRRKFVATVVKPPMAGDSTVSVVPMDVRFPKVRIQSRSWRRYLGARICVQVDSWDQDSKLPTGHCIQMLGEVGDLETEMKALLIEHEIELEPFSPAAESCLPIEGSSWTVRDNHLTGRKDFRKQRCIFSVDPPGCQDIDDTMHAEVLSNGDIEVGVHIADVTHFVAQNSALDLEARKRGTTFYFVDRRFDMLPTLLSSNLCSLHGNVDRLAVSVVWTFSSDFSSVKNTWYGRSVIRNCAAMTYDQAEAILQNRTLVPCDVPPLTAGGPVDPRLLPSITKSLSILTELGRTLKARRKVFGGSVELIGAEVGTELKFKLDESGHPIQCLPKQEKEIHHTIAEMMILANGFVAETLHAKDSSRALLRIHQTMEEDKLVDLKAALEAEGISLNGRSNQELAKALHELRSRDLSPSIHSLFQSLATRAMMEAKYVCTGSLTENADFSHYGLGLTKYTHFTSPIRRYADVMVHNQLLSSPEAPPLTPLGVGPVEALHSLPSSNAVSILAGEGLHGDRYGESIDDMVDAMIDGAAFDLQLIDPPEPRLEHLSKAEGAEKERLSIADVTEISDHLNVHNRMAKISSMECQRLFLSLYFKKETAIEKAVVTDVFSNGLRVFIPKFDMKAPIFLCTRKGQIQIDPRVLGLPLTSGDVHPSSKFGSFVHLFQGGTCNQLENDRLLVTVPAAREKLTVKRLDVLSVLIGCEDFDMKARVPKPTVHLVQAQSLSQVPNVGPINDQEVSVDYSLAQQNQVARTRTISSVIDDVKHQQTPSVDRDFAGGNISSRLEKNPSKMTGRMVFRDFHNPDTRQSNQNNVRRAAEERTKMRREKLIAHRERRNEYDVSRTVEKEATTRQQRLAASKRNAKRGKAGK